MSENIIHSQDRHSCSIDEITSPIGAQLLEFCEQATLNNGCHEEQSSHHMDMTKYTSHNEINPSNFSIFFDDQLEHDISASIDFSSSPSYSTPHQQPFNVNQLHMMDIPPLHHYAPLEDDCLPYLPSQSVPYSAENSGIFTGLMLGGDLSNQELDFRGESGGFLLPDNVFSCSSDQLQALSSESQHLVHGGTSTTPLTSDISSLDDPTFKVEKLSVEERKRKIDRYMQKRNERNFSKKIKYACRKTLADSRPRVRGRFAKNDELEEIARTMSSNHEDDIDDDVSLYSNAISDHQKKVGVKEEEDLESADIFAHISGVNSFKCNYPIQSWI